MSIDSFQNLDKLRILDLSFNGLHQLDAGLLAPLKSLRELWLNGNQLTSVAPNTFNNNAVKLIRLEDNPWHCTCQLEQLRPTSVNKIRSLGSDGRIVYSYDRNVAPVCATPAIYSHKDLFSVLRKELRCGKVNHQDKANKSNHDYLVVDGGFS